MRALVVSCHWCLAQLMREFPAAGTGVRLPQGAVRAAVRIMVRPAFQP